MTVLLIQLSKCYTRWNSLKRGISDEFSKVLPPLWWDLQVHERLKFPALPAEGCTTIACWFLQGSPVGVSGEIQVSTESSYHCKQAKLSDHNIWQFWQVCLVVHQGAIVSIGKGVEKGQVGSVWSIFQILWKWKWKCCKKRRQDVLYLNIWHVQQFPEDENTRCLQGLFDQLHCCCALQEIYSITKNISRRLTFAVLAKRTNCSKGLAVFSLILMKMTSANLRQDIKLDNG